jgi:heterotetrameric sarcosine oxidase gamma subunit
MIRKATGCMVERVHPLQVLAANSAQCAHVTLSIVPPPTRIVVRVGRHSIEELGDMVGVTLPTQACRSNASHDRVALWFGPDEWLVLADQDVGLPVAHPDGSIVDVSHAMTGITVSGVRAAWAINAFCALDLHPVAFPIGMCTRTVFGKVEIVLWRTAAETFRIEVGRSFAPYVWACLEEARREFLA